MTKQKNDEPPDAGAGIAARMDGSQPLEVGASPRFSRLVDLIFAHRELLS